MKDLFQALYGCIAEDRPVPIPYREILLTSKIMDEIFLQLAAMQPGVKSVDERESNLIVASPTG